MTRKDFVLIADALKSCRPDVSASDPAWQSWAQCVRCVAQALGGTNSRFDRARFIAHCEA